jgi:hypothetical protein
VDKGRRKHSTIWLTTLAYPRAASLSDEDLAVELVIDDIQHNTELSDVVLHDVIRFPKRLHLFIEGLGADAHNIAQMLTTNLVCRARVTRHAR